MIDDYRKGWALRYLREAKAELTAAQKTPYMASSLTLEAVKKAQAAIYYSLGDPAFIDSIVRQAMHEKRSIDDPILGCLVGVEQTIEEIAQTLESEPEKAFEQADGLIQTAAKVVELFTGERAD